MDLAKEEVQTQITPLTKILCTLVPLVLGGGVLGISLIIFIISYKNIGLFIVFLLRSSLVNLIFLEHNLFLPSSEIYLRNIVQG